MCECKKRLTRLFVVVGALASTAMLGVAPAHAGSIHADLRPVLADTRVDQPVSTLVYLKDRVDLPALEVGLRNQRALLQFRHEMVVRALQKKAQGSQVAILNYLAARQQAGTVMNFTPIWIVNAVLVEALPSEVRSLAARNDVETVYLNYAIESITPADDVPDDGGAGGPEPGVVAVRAPEVWALGITGAGTLTSTLDTGVDGNHPSLASRWRGLNPAYAGHSDWAWFDPVTNTSFPQAFGSHGTHTMGSVCGGLPGDEVGVAPGADWIHAAVIDRVSIARTVADSILAFQWLIDPDGDPSTNFDVADVCSNSWGLRTGHGYAPCDETFWSFLDACEAAGIVILFSAGNEGFSEMRRPADRATNDYRTAAVAAVDGNNPSWPIASFSSRGPTYCTPNGSAAIKPEIAAPGVSVRSAMPGGGYGFKSGTSMASPHVNGVVCLMREANPNLGVDEIKQIIYDTAFDLGATGNDNSYGWGMIDAFEAVQEALARRVGACCLPNGSCLRTDEDDCLARCGVFRGGGTLCLAICEADIEFMSAAAPTGGTNSESEAQAIPCKSACRVRATQACCFDGGTCSDLNDCLCDLQGGTPQGSGSDCSTVDCPPPGGGCCLEDGTCTVTDQATCEGQCGTYQGDNSNCNLSCPIADLETCCFDDATCSEATACACLQQGGTPKGTLNDCGSGACCYRDGRCSNSNLCACQASRGFFRGSGTSCSTVLCPSIKLEKK